MNKILLTLVVFLAFTFSSLAQIQPEDGASLRYRLIGFSFPADHQADGYHIEIAKGSFSNEDSFKNNIIVTKKTDKNKIIAEVPLFSNEYTWRYFAAGSKTKSKLYHFSTFTPGGHASNTNFSILKHAEKYADAYVFLDETRGMYNMEGQAVWFLPSSEELGCPNVPIRDIKLTPQGTITFLADGIDAYEINYNGDVLWKGPNNGTVSGALKEGYHHELTRMSNGHYMVLGTAHAMLRPPGAWPDSMAFKRRRDMAGPGAGRGDSARQGRPKNMGMPFGSIIEYDQQGKVVWSWKSSSYFIGSDIINYIGPGGRRQPDVHLNSFYFDEKSQVIYASFKNISRIIKIKYPEGTVLNTFGEIYSQGVPEMGNGLFCFQHACKINADGQLYLFNNNSCNPECPPEIIVMQEAANEKSGLEKIWAYECPVAALNFTVRQQSTPKADVTVGGNVIELPDQSYFVSLCAPYGLVFIVSKEKKIIWSGQPERWNPTEEMYKPFPQYRASIIANSKDMEHLIWSQQNKK